MVMDISATEEGANVSGNVSQVPESMDGPEISPEETSSSAPVS